MTQAALRRNGARLALAVGMTLVSLASVTSGVAAQAAPDSVTADSLAAQADSARQAILRRLERLARAPGADSVLYVQDSVRMAAAEAGIRPGSGPDSVATALRTMPGYSMVEYEGDSADFAASERILKLFAPAEGRAKVSQEGSVIEADTSIVFNEATGAVRAVGGATFTPPEGDPVDAEDMVFDLNQGRGTALNATTSWNQDGAEWIVRGDMPFAAQDSTFMAHARFTSCDIEEPHYHFETDEIKIVGGNVLVARGVRLYFADVPVAWLPFLAQSLSRGRSSGLLTPRFSVNDIVRTSGGYQRRVSNVGFYWAMSDYTDALFAMDWFSQNFISVTSSFRYRISRQFLNGDLSFRRYWNADGSRDLALDTRHDWQIDERTQLRASARFIDNTEFVTEYSTNPREVTQSIDSEAGINRRFDWGTLSASANRKEYLSDERVEWLLPSLNVSLSPITLFRAPSSEASVFNNMTWSGSGGLTRNTVERMQSDTFDISMANTAASRAFARSNLALGNLTFGQSVDLSENKRLGVPEAYLMVDETGSTGDILLADGPLRDVSEATLGWSASVNYQQQLIGSTTLTPRLSVSGSLFRSDTEPLAENFVAAPSRLTFGAQLRTDIYGFFGGVGPFEAIRHKISPSFDYQYSPESAPTDLQREVFGSRVLQPKNAISLSLTQTFEAKRASPEEDGLDGGLQQPLVGPDGLPLDPRDPLAPVDSTTAQDPLRQADDPNAGPRRVQQNPSVTLLAWRTSVIQYDFVEADSVGLFLSGFETTRLSNQFSSDFLRGMSVSMDHELFEDVFDEDRRLVERRFSPHLSQVNLSFSLGSRSSIFRWLGFGGGADDPPEEPGDEDPLAGGGPTDESTVVPITGRDGPVGPVRSSGSAGGWTANVSYSLQRPRDDSRPASQMLSGTIRMEPTQNWSLSWRTSYDIDRAAFNDHSIRLSRDLHRWQANFDFLQTASGNWTFRFEVSLLDNRDLKFDYRQRNQDLGQPSSQR